MHHWLGICIEKFALFADRYVMHFQTVTVIGYEYATAEFPFQYFKLRSPWGHTTKSDSTFLAWLHLPQKTFILTLWGTVDNVLHQINKKVPTRPRRNINFIVDEPSSWWYWRCKMLSSIVGKRKGGRRPGGFVRYLRRHITTYPYLLYSYSKEVGTDACW